MGLTTDSSNYARRILRMGQERYYVFLSVQKLLQKWILKLFIVLHIILDCACWDNFFVLNFKSDDLCYYHIIPDLIGIHCKVSPLQVTILRILLKQNTALLSYV